MAISDKVLIAGKYLENAIATQYTAVNCKTKIDSFIVTNDSANNVQLTVYLVEFGVAASGVNRFIKTRSIAPGETYKCTEIVGQMLDAGGFIATNASAASSLACRAVGREITA